jgi:hypothetical protein
MSAITDLASVKSLIGKTDANSDAVFAQIIAAASTALGNYCNLNFDEHEFIEDRDGNGAGRMMLANYPIAAIHTVTINGAAVGASNGLPSGRGWRARVGSRAVMLDGGARFAEGHRNVTITGTAGYGGVNPWPADLSYAANIWVAARYAERQRYGGVSSKSLAGESIGYTQPDPATGSASTGIPAAAKLILQNYMNTVPESGL